MGIMLADASKHLQGLASSMMNKTGIVWDVNTDTVSGFYNRIKNKASIGGKCLRGVDDFGVVYDTVSEVDYVSVSKQCFHEYRHWWQYNKLFTKQETGGMFSDLIENMAVQSMISSVFPNYVRDVKNPFVKMNYFDMIMELDAEQYGLLKSREYLLEDGLISPDIVDTCLREEICRRIDWWGTRPVLSIDDAIWDLDERKNNFRHLSLVFDYERRRDMSSPVYTSFVSNSDNVDKYLSLSDDEQDQFLIDYICRHNADVAKNYSLVLGDRMPDLSSVEKFKRRSYMITHNIFDENQISDRKSDVHNKRISDLDSRFGNALNGSDVSPDVSFGE